MVKNTFIYMIRKLIAIDWFSIVVFVVTLIAAAFLLREDLSDRTGVEILSIVCILTILKICLKIKKPK
jgi:hypothetical protein